MAGQNASGENTPWQIPGRGISSQCCGSRIRDQNQAERFMKNKKISGLLVATALGLGLGVNAPAQTNGPAAPTGLRVQALTELAEAQPVPSQLEPSKPMPSRPMPSQPQPSLPMPVVPGQVPPTPTPPGPIYPGQGIEPVPPSPFQPAQPGQPAPNRPPLFTNRPPVLTSHAPVFTNHPAELLPGDI